MEQVRPSILRRPVRETHCCKESAEDQYRREQELIAARGRRLMASEARLMGSLYPTPEVQQQRLQELEATKQQQLEAQAAERQREAALLSAFSGPRPTTAPPAARPWEAASFDYNNHQEQERARRDLEARVADENRRLAVAKALERHQQRQAEAEAVRQQLQQPDANFWNLGAVPATGRFIAPQQRWVVGAAAAADLYKPLLSRPSGALGAAAVTGGSLGSSPAAAAAPYAWASSGGSLAGKDPVGGIAALGVGAAGAGALGGIAAGAVRGGDAVGSALVGGAGGAADIAASGMGMEPRVSVGASGGYAGLTAPWATTGTPPAAGAAAKTAAAVAAVGVQKSLALQPPWATHDTLPAGSIPRRLSSGNSRSSNDSTAMGALLGGEGQAAAYLQQQQQQQQRPATAAAGAAAAARKYPWEWPNA